jgi:hypothetical protein
MMSRQTVDGVLVEWGERLFYPANRRVRPAFTPLLRGSPSSRAAHMRERIDRVARRAPQVMVKVTGGGRGMKAIAAHFRYISKNGRLDIEDDRGEVRAGKDVIGDLVEQWRYGGALIEDASPRREAFNIMLSMPAGTDAGLLKRAVREFAQAELAGHRYVMVLHEHQANPHVHLSVRAQSATGKRLNPRKTDLHRWRETFAEKLRGWGIEAEATRQASRGEGRSFDPLWRVKAQQDGRLRRPGAEKPPGGSHFSSRAQAMQAWAHVMRALGESEVDDDRKLAKRIASFVLVTPFARKHLLDRDTEVSPTRELFPPGKMSRERAGPERSR